MDKWEKAITLQRELLKNRHGCSLQYIIEKFEHCNRSTVYRTKELAEMLFGVDIIKDKKTKNFRLDLHDGDLTELPGLWFKKSELEALICLQQAMSGLQNGYMEELLVPFRERFKPILKAQGVDTDAWDQRFRILSIFTREVTTSTFETIADAVLHGFRVQVQYRKLGQKESDERIISPQTLVRYRDNWYIDSWCHLREDLRTFSLNRICFAKKLKEKVTVIPRDQLDSHHTASYGIFSGPAHNIAEILFTGTAAYEVSQERWHPNQTGTWDDIQQAYLLKIPYGTTTELLMDILRWGDQAEIIAPAKLRDEIAGIIGRMQGKYSG